METKEKKKCPICDKMIRSIDLQRHIQFIHLDTTRKCNECGKMMSSISFKRHVLSMHQNKKEERRPRTKESVNCDLCEKQFHSIYTMQRHKKVVHLKLRQFSCKYCGKYFNDHTPLRHHEQIHEADGAKRKLMVENCDLTHHLEEGERMAAQLSKDKTSLTTQLEDAKRLADAETRVS